MANGWNLWVWLQCIGLVSGCCCKPVHVYSILTISINFPDRDLLYLQNV